jgi:hypothetical protein
MKTNEWVIGVMLGLFFIMGAVSKGDWFTVQWLVKSIGRNGARFAYALLGIVLIVVSLSLRR